MTSPDTAARVRKPDPKRRAGPPDDRAGRRKAVLVVACFALVACAALVLPGRTVTTMYLNDLLIFLDGAHRILEGQVPGRDFHTALGPLVFYAPALGLRLTDDMGAAMPVATALYALLLLPAMLQIFATRLPAALVLIAGAFFVAILVMPANPGDGISAVTFAMFYNRVGWMAFSTLLVLHLPPDRPHRRQEACDVVAVVVLVLAVAFTKASYAAAVPVLFAFLLFDPAKRRMVASASLVAAVSGIALALTWGGWAGHLDDLLLAASVSGGPRSISDSTSVILRNLADHVLFIFAAALAVRRTRSGTDAAFYGLCAVVGFLLIRQNFQSWGILTLHAGIVVAAATLLRPMPGRPVRRGAEFLALAALLPTTLHGMLAVGLHAGLAVTDPGRPFDLPRFRHVHLARTWTGDPSHGSYAAYLDSLHDGAKALQSLGENAERVFVLDFVTPFSAGLGLRPAKGDSAWQHWGRNFDDRNFEPPETLLRNVNVVMEPKNPIEEGTARGLAENYAAYIERNFTVAVETPFWIVRMRIVPDEDLIADRESDSASLQPGGQTTMMSGTPSSTTSAESGAPSRQ